MIKASIRITIAAVGILGIFGLSRIFPPNLHPFEFQIGAAISIMTTGIASPSTLNITFGAPIMAVALAALIIETSSLVFKAFKTFSLLTAAGAVYIAGLSTILIIVGSGTLDSYDDSESKGLLDPYINKIATRYQTPVGNLLKRF